MYFEKKQKAVDFLVQRKMWRMAIEERCLEGDKQNQQQIEG